MSYVRIAGIMYFVHERIQKDEGLDQGLEARRN